MYSFSFALGPYHDSSSLDLVLSKRIKQLLSRFSKWGSSIKIFLNFGSGFLNWVLESYNWYWCLSSAQKEKHCETCKICIILNLKYATTKFQGTMTWSIIFSLSMWKRIISFESMRPCWISQCTSERPILCCRNFTINTWVKNDPLHCQHAY